MTTITPSLAEEQAIVERDWNERAKVLKYELKVLNFREGDIPQKRLYSVSIAAGPLYACHFNATQGVLEAKEEQFFGVPHDVLVECLSHLYEEVKMKWNYVSHNHPVELLTEKRADVGYSLVRFHSYNFEKETEKWEAMWRARCTDIMKALKAFFKGYVPELQMMVLQQIRIEWLAERH